MSTIKIRWKCVCQCECGSPAVMTDDAGEPVCAECATFICTDDGEVICARQTESFTRCHVCREEIRWGRIETSGSGTGSPNYCRGSCACGDGAWRHEDRGGWGHYSYDGTLGRVAE